MNRMGIGNSILANQHKIQQNNVGNKKLNTNVNIGANKTNFKEVLDSINSNNELKFSKHAKSRLEARNISLTSEEIDKLNSAIDKADKKGVTEALILMDNTALIASVRNRTIITVASEGQLKENVFTNIDGAVIV